jgi:hypothetical protein
MAKPTTNPIAEEITKHSVTKQPWRHDRLAHPLLHQDERDNQNDEADDQGKSCGELPRPHRPAQTGHQHDAAGRARQQRDTGVIDDRLPATAVFGSTMATTISATMPMGTLM